MKTTLVTLLAAVLCVEQGKPLMLLLVKAYREDGGNFSRGKTLEGCHPSSIALLQPCCHQLPFAP